MTCAMLTLNHRRREKANGHRMDAFLKLLSENSISENDFWERAVMRRWRRRFSSLRGKADTCPGNSVMSQFPLNDTMCHESPLLKDCEPKWKLKKREFCC